MSLYDLFGFTQEERQAFSTGRKPKRKKKQAAPQLSLFDIVEPLSGQSVPGKGMPLPHRPQKSPDYGFRNQSPVGRRTSGTGAPPGGGRGRTAGAHEATPLHR